jgi:hypothetical protein
MNTGQQVAPLHAPVGAEYTIGHLLIWIFARWAWLRVAPAVVVCLLGTLGALTGVRALLVTPRPVDARSISTQAIWYHPSVVLSGVAWDCAAAIPAGDGSSYVLGRAEGVGTQVVAFVPSPPADCAAATATPMRGVLSGMNERTAQELRDRGVAVDSSAVVIVPEWSRQDALVAIALSQALILFGGLLIPMFQMLVELGSDDLRRRQARAAPPVTSRWG